MSTNKNTARLQLASIAQSKALVRLGFDWTDALSLSPPVALALKWFRDVRGVDCAVTFQPGCLGTGWFGEVPSEGDPEYAVRQFTEDYHTHDEAESALLDALLETQAIKNKNLAAATAAEAKRKLFCAHLKEWAVANPEEFGGKKSLEFLHGMLVFRTGTLSVVQLRGFTEEDSIEILMENGSEYIRTKEELDREAILRAVSNGEFAADELARCGLKVEQRESFKVEEKLETATA